MRNSSYLLVAYFFEAFFGFFLLVILARVLPKESLGTYTFVVSILSLASVSSLAGLKSAVARSLCLKEPIPLTLFLKKTLRYSLLGSGFLALLSTYYFWKDDLSLTFTLIILTAIYPFIYSFGNVASGYFTAKEAFKAQMFIGISVNFLIFTGVAGTALLSASPFAILLVYCLIQIFANIGIYIYVRSRLPKCHKQDADTFSYGLFLSKMSVLNMLALQLDQLLLGFLMPISTVADYRILSSLSNVIKNIEKSSSQTLLPKFLNFKEGDIQKARMRHILLLVLLGGAFTGFALLIQPFFITLFFGESYRSVIGLAQIMVLSLVFVPMEIYSQQFFCAFKKTVAIEWTSYITPLFKICITLLFFYLWGFTGIVLSQLASRLFNVLSDWILLQTTGERELPPPA